MPKTIFGGVLNGKAKSLPKPEYPAAARAAKAHGEVKVQVLIDEQGNIISATAESGHPLLQAAAIEAALQAKFTPTLLSGQPVKVSGVIVYRFVPESHDDRVKPLSIAAFLAIGRKFTKDPEKLKIAFEGEDLMGEASKETALFPPLGKLVDYEKLTPEKRSELLDKVGSEIRAKLSGPEQWQFDVGTNFGDVMGPLMFLMASGSEPSAIRTLDEAELRTSLSRLNSLLPTAPDDFPKDILGKLKTLASLADRPNLLSDENLAELGESIVALAETISPDKE